MKSKIVIFIFLVTLGCFVASGIFWKLTPKEIFQSFPNGIFKFYSHNSATGREKVHFQTKEKNIRKVQIVTAAFIVEIGKSSSNEVEIEGEANVVTESLSEDKSKDKPKEAVQLSTADIFKITKKMTAS